jgi:ankyrin repeat protein
MQTKPLAYDAPLSDYERQAGELLAGYRARDGRALALLRALHPRFRDERVAWLARDASDFEVAAAGFDLDDARLAAARGYSFADWGALSEWVEAVGRRGDVFRFESVVEAVIDGDVATLERLLAQDPELVRARSTRRTCFDPPVHRATLLHYVGANGLEGHRQRTPPNAPAIARALLEAGAEPDALAGFYGIECATLSLLVSSSHPAEAGVQGELVELLLDHGAAIEGRGERWGSPLATALLFGCTDAAQTLVRRGARVDCVSVAAGLGLADHVAKLLPASGAPSRHLALALAAQLGHAGVVRQLLDAGEDPNRYNPEGGHAHATPLHQAALAGHLDVVRLLVERGARRDVRDTIYSGTPLDWARHAGQREIEVYLRSLDGA